MANASQVRAALEKELARMRKASERFEARLKLTADDVTTGAQEFEKVLEKEIAPNVSAGLKGRAVGHFAAQHLVQAPAQQVGAGRSAGRCQRGSGEHPLGVLRVMAFERVPRYSRT